MWFSSRTFRWFSSKIRNSATGHRTAYHLIYIQFAWRIDGYAHLAQKLLHMQTMNKKMATTTATAAAVTVAATTLVRRMFQAELNVPCDTQSPIYNNINKPAGRNGNAPSLQIVPFSFTTLQPYRELPMFGVHVFVQAHFFFYVAFTSTHLTPQHVSSHTNIYKRTRLSVLCKSTLHWAKAHTYRHRYTHSNANSDEHINK